MLMELIDKSALVAEIEKLKEEIESQDFAAYAEAYIIGVKHTLETVLDILNTLEVKEVDLDYQDIYSILYLERMVMRDFGDKEYSHEELCQEVLKRFNKERKQQ